MGSRAAASVVEIDAQPPAWLHNSVHKKRAAKGGALFDTEDVRIKSLDHDWEIALANKLDAFISKATEKASGDKALAQALPVVDHEPEMALNVLRLMPAGAQCDELVAEIDEGLAGAAATQLEREETAVESERRVDVDHTADTRSASRKTTVCAREAGPTPPGMVARAGVSRAGRVHRPLVARGIVDLGTWQELGLSPSSRDPAGTERESRSELHGYIDVIIRREQTRVARLV